MDSATWTVHDESSCAMISGHRNWFQLPMKSITAMAAKNPVQLGTTTRQNTPHRFSPSSLPASSSSTGKSRKNWRNRNTLSALNKPGTTRPRRSEIQPRLDTTTKLGTNVTAVGTIRLAITA